MDAVFRRVLIPVDFVPAEDDDDRDVLVAGGQRLRVGKGVRESLELGTALAAGGTVRLVHAAPSLLFSAVYGGPEGAWIPSETMRNLDQQVEETTLTILREFGARFGAGANVEVAAQAGNPFTVILDEAHAFAADLIVLPTSGHGRAKRFFLGSTADKVIRQAHCPVLVVPSEVVD